MVVCDFSERSHARSNHVSVMSHSDRSRHVNLTILLPVITRCRPY